MGKLMAKALKAYKKENDCKSKFERDFNCTFNLKTHQLKDVSIQVLYFLCGLVHSA